MSTEKGATTTADDVKIDVCIKLPALWISVMFYYIYGDYFGLFTPGALRSCSRCLSSATRGPGRSIRMCSTLPCRHQP